MEIHSEVVHSGGNDRIAFTAQCWSKTLFPICGQGLCVFLKITGMLSLLQIKKEWKDCVAFLNDSMASLMKTNFI